MRRNDLKMLMVSPRVEKSDWMDVVAEPDLRRLPFLRCAQSVAMIFEKSQTKRLDSLLLPVVVMIPEGVHCRGRTQVIWVQLSNKTTRNTLRVGATILYGTRS